MRTLIIGALIASSTVALASAPARAEGAYVSVSAGAINLRDAELEYPDNAERDRFASFDNGLVISGAVGRSVRDFRFEGEIAYRANDEAFIMPGMGGEGSAQSWAFIGNAYWDMPVEWRVRPYLGAGLGAAMVSHDGFVVADLGEEPMTLADDSGWGLAYQGMAGVRTPLGEDWLWTAEYRYFSVAEPKIDDAEGFTYDTDYDSHALMVGLARRL
jgi:OmpA-OmpF porin, OOP family